jgi:hypothetical protein
MVEYTVLFGNEELLLAFSCTNLDNFWISDSLINFFILTSDSRYDKLNGIKYMFYLLVNTGAYFGINDIDSTYVCDFVSLNHVHTII